MNYLPSPLGGWGLLRVSERKSKRTKVCDRKMKNAKRESFAEGGRPAGLTHPSIPVSGEVWRRMQFYEATHPVLEATNENNV